MVRALVLNVTERPLAVVPATRAVVLVLKEKADVLVSNGVVFHSEKLTIPAPSVVKLKYFVTVPYRTRGTLSRRAVLVRDDFECQYCGAPAENVDHIQPRSLGGTHTWENVVACCRRCNSRKENRSPAEVGLKLRRPPRAPQNNLFLIVSVGKLHPTWEPYLISTGAAG